jgi:hypothetical protein
MEVISDAIIDFNEKKSHALFNNNDDIITKCCQIISSLPLDHSLQFQSN